MSAVDELLKFLKIVADDLKRREEKVPISLLRLHVYCDKYFKKKKFEVKKFKALFKTCKDDLLELSRGGYIHFETAEEKSNFFMKMDNLEKRVIALEIAREYNDVLDELLEWDDFRNRHSISYIAVSNATERERNPGLEPIFDLHGHEILYYPAVEIEELLYAVVPRMDSVIDSKTYESGVIGFIFNCPNFNPQFQYNRVRVIKPALFLRPDWEVRQSWTLVEKGELDLGEGHLESSKTEIIQHMQRMTWEEAALIASVNKWWKEGGTNKDALINLLNNISLPAQFYTILNITENLKDPTIRSYTFQPCDYAEWLWYQPQGQQEVLALPANSNAFTGGTITIARRMFSGFGEAWSEVSFERVYKACHLRQISSDKYEVISRGYILLHGFQDPSLPLPQTYENLIQQRR